MKLILFTIILLSSFSSKADISCFYPSKKDSGSLAVFDNCGSINGDKVKLGDAHTKNIVYDKNGLACIYFPNKPDLDVFYTHKSGDSQRVILFDNSCDYFKEGLARGLDNGQMVFINQQLEIVLIPEHEMLFPFHYGHSIVCNGPFIEEKRGEHTLQKGGKCGLLNKQGDLVVKANYKIGDQKAFQHYINTNNHCPSPPITSESSALCHAKRHVTNMEFHTIEWEKHEISNQGNIWLITFVEKNMKNEEFSLILISDTAQWESMTQESHNNALQRTSQ